MGIKVWQPYLYEVEMSRVQRRYFGGFLIRNFKVPHDDVNCCGFVIECPNGEKVLYATDFEYIPFSFKKMRIHHLLIEANYQKKYVDSEAVNRNHVLKGHAELAQTLNIIKDNADSLKTVILCHLSHENANAEEMLAEVQKVAKIPCYIATKGIEIELKGDECPF